MSTPIDQPPAWVADAVFYQIFPDRFAASPRVIKPNNLEPWDAPPTAHGYKGGDLAGVRERLDWLTDLGVDAIYFNPVFRSASNHRYHTHDYFAVDPLLGGNDALTELLQACHERGIRVVLDGVFNHASRGFYQFNDLLENGRQSPWVDWFHIHGWPLKAYDPDFPTNYTAWWGLHALPKLNTDNPQVREYLMQVAEHWVRQGIDGWRLDVPEEIRTEGFWEEFRERVKAVNPDAYIVGEIWHEAGDWVGGKRFDGVMNYVFTGYVLRYVAGSRVVDEVVEGITYQVRPAHDAGGYADAVDYLLALYPATSTQANLNLLGSHDTPRLMTVVGDDTASVVLANVLLFTFPGAPCVYYGDEIGLGGGRDPECRKAFPWDDEPSWNPAVLAAVRRLAALRHEHPALRSSDYERLWPRPGEYGQMLYVCRRSAGDEQIIVAVNAGEAAESATISVPGLAPSGFRTLFGQGGISADATTLRLAVPPRTGAIWQVQPAP